MSSWEVFQGTSELIIYSPSSAFPLVFKNSPGSLSQLSYRSPQWKPGMYVKYVKLLKWRCLDLDGSTVRYPGKHLKSEWLSPKCLGLTSRPRTSLDWWSLAKSDIGMVMCIGKGGESYWKMPELSRFKWCSWLWCGHYLAFYLVRYMTISKLRPYGPSTRDQSLSGDYMWGLPWRYFHATRFSAHSTCCIHYHTLAVTCPTPHLLEHLSGWWL